MTRPEPASCRATPPPPSPALRQAFEATHYEVEGPAPAVFRIGQDGPQVAGWLSKVGARSACIVTAWNPFSREMPAEENARRQQALLDRVEAAGLRCLPARGRDPSGQWPPEDSLCVLDASEAMLADWLRGFDQYAAVTVSARAGCRLRWHPALRACPLRPADA